uniref:Uncharacterized protein n=1 Tax=Anguilla anguilla TaxID=7936 RepID=A0A0E9XHR8_ANGAN
MLFPQISHNWASTITLNIINKRVCNFYDTCLFLTLPLNMAAKCQLSFVIL